MLNEKETTKLSKFLSLVLRHQPEAISLHLDQNGWAKVPELLDKLRVKNFSVDHETLKNVVETNHKKRFAFNDDETMIRASQGHSVSIDLAYATAVPPRILYHGTAEKNIASILNKGLLKQSRQHVHLSAGKETAVDVGKRHGKPVVLEVLSEKMHNDGYAFFLSANGVWLTDFVPAIYLHLPQSTSLKD